MGDYVYPTSIEEAVEYLQRHEGQARIIAGGTDVLPDWRKGKVAPRCLVDITRIPDLRRIEVEDGMVTVGAAVTFAAIREHAFLSQRVHALIDGARSVGAAAIQNAATWVGNIVQAMPAADGAIVALVLDAYARVVDHRGARWEPVAELFEGPGLSTVDPRRELVTHIRFPSPGPNTGTAWRRVGRRAGLVLPILNCAVKVELDVSYGADLEPEGDGARIVDVAIALGPVAPRPVRSPSAEQFLVGRLPRPEIIERAGTLARSDANPRTSVMRASKDYRLKILPALVSEALTTAVERARRGSKLVGATSAAGRRRDKVGRGVSLPPSRP
jgi:carbon-monoxide dehydrogenase medium subunit